MSSISQKISELRVLNCEEYPYEMPICKSQHFEETLTKSKVTGSLLFKTQTHSNVRLVCAQFMLYIFFNWIGKGEDLITSIMRWTRLQDPKERPHI